MFHGEIAEVCGLCMVIWVEKRKKEMMKLTAEGTLFSGGVFGLGGHCKENDVVKTEVQEMSRVSNTEMKKIKVCATIEIDSRRRNKRREMRKEKQKYHF